MNEKLGDASRRGFLALCGGAVASLLLGGRAPVQASSTPSSSASVSCSYSSYSKAASNWEDAVPLPRKYIWAANATGRTILAGEPVFWTQEKMTIKGQ